MLDHQEGYAPGNKPYPLPKVLLSRWFSFSQGGNMSIPSSRYSSDTLSVVKITPPKTKISHEKWWLEDEIPFKTLGIQSPSENGFMEPEYLAFRRWWRTPLAHHLTFGEPGSVGKFLYHQLGFWNELFRPRNELIGVVSCIFRGASVKGDSRDSQ